MNQSLEHIIKACLQKDQRAMRALYDLFVDRLYFVCRRYVRDKYYIENILQDVFLKAFKALDRFDPIKASFNTWITTIAIRESLNHIRKNKIEFSPIDEKLQVSANVDPLLLEMDTEELLAVIDTLQEKYKIIFNLYEVDGYSHSEIAAMLGINISTSRSYLARAKKMIQKEIKFCLN